MEEDNSANQAFIQAFLAHGSLTLEKAKPIIAAIFNAYDEATTVAPADITQAHFDSFLDHATRALAPFDFLIRRTKHQMTGTTIYALTNVTSDEVTELATTRTLDENAFVRRLLDAIFETNNSPRLELMAVAPTTAVNLRKPLRNSNNRCGNQNDNDQAHMQKAAEKGLTIDEAEMVIETMISEGWFEKTPKKYITLSPRGLMELRRWLIETYNDPDVHPDEWQRIKFCEACKEIVTIGLRCATPLCNFRLHDTCADAFFRTQAGGSRKCSHCSAAWDGTHYVGDRALGRDREVRQSKGAEQNMGSSYGQLEDGLSDRMSDT